jgi:uncharacterized protein
MRIFLALTLVLASTAPGLFADAASKDAKIEQFLTLIKANAIQDQIYAQLGGQIDRATKGLAQGAGIPAAEQQSAVADLQAQMTSEMHANMNWDKLKPEIIAAYRDAYSEEELDGLLAFFKSPVGQAYIAKSPTVAAKTREIAEARVKILADKFQAMGKEWADKHPRLAPAPK